MDGLLGGALVVRGEEKVTTYQFIAKTLADADVAMFWCDLEEERWLIHPPSAWQRFKRWLAGGVA